MTGFDENGGYTARNSIDFGEKSMNLKCAIFM